MSPARTLRSSLLLLTLAPAALRAQAPSAAEPTLEVMGLERWTVEMIADSVARYAPGVDLVDAACAVILRDSVGFAQAAVQTMRYSDRTWVTLSVVEPQHSERVRVRQYADTLPLREAWRPAVDIMREHRQAVSALQDAEFLTARSDTMWWGERPDSATLALRDLIARLARSQGDSLALWTLAHDAGQDNRIVASLILGHFADRESTWHALASALSGPSNFATSMSSMILNGVATSPIPIDWAPVESDLAAVLGGTNLFAWIDLVRILYATGIEPTLARRLVAASPELFADNAGSANPSRSRATSRFLERAGAPHPTADPAAWSDWVDNL